MYIPFFIIVIQQRSIAMSKQQDRNYILNYTHYFKMLSGL